MEGENVRVVRAFLEAWSAKDWDRWQAMHGERVVHTGPDHAIALLGPSEVVEAHRTLAEAFPDFRYEPRRIFGEGKSVCAEVVLTGHQTGPMRGPGGTTIAPTGRPVHVLGCLVFAVEGGLIAEYRDHTDLLGMLEQLGAAKGYVGALGSPGP